MLILITFYEFGDDKVLSDVKCHFKYAVVEPYRVTIIRTTCRPTYMPGVLSGTGLLLLCFIL